jgi:ADP-heptose:LPS heptosyltransferase
MFLKQRRSIGLVLARMRFRKQQVEQLTFSHAFSDAKSALVIVPVDRTERSQAIPFLRSLQQKFKGNKLTVVSLDSTRDLSSALSQCSMFPVHEKSLTWFQLPRRETVEHLYRQKFDIALDLNTTFELAAAYICRSVDAVYHIGFAKEHSDTFYNFQFRTSPQKNPQTRYAQLLQVLAMF